MIIKIPEETRILVLEGIAGSGKTTLKEYLRKMFKDRKLQEFTEEELLLGWKHIHVRGVSPLRVDFANVLLDHIEEKLQEDEDLFFILERFHLSMKILEWEFEKEFNRRYEEIVTRLSKLPVFVLITELKDEEIRLRMHHRERNEQWNRYCDEKLIVRGYEDLETLSVDQQKAFFDTAESQSIPYSGIHVDLNIKFLTV